MEAPVPRTQPDKRKTPTPQMWLNVIQEHSAATFEIIIIAPIRAIQPA